MANNRNSQSRNRNRNRNRIAEPKPLTVEEIKALPADDYVAYLTNSDQLASLTGASPLYVTGKLPRGFFGQRLTSLTKEAIVNYAKEYKANPASKPEQSRNSKYTLTVEVEPEAKRGRKVIPAQLVTLPNTMAMINALCILSHGDYHTNNAIRVLAKLGYEVEGKRALSFDHKAYIQHKAEKDKAEAEAKIEALKVEALAEVEALIGSASNKAKRKALPALVEAKLVEAGIPTNENPGKALYSKAKRLASK